LKLNEHLTQNIRTITWFRNCLGVLAVLFRSLWPREVALPEKILSKNPQVNRHCWCATFVFGRRSVIGEQSDFGPAKIALG
jgi:hypothetical protein